MTTKKAFWAIIDNKHEKALNYAVNYAYAGLNMSGKELDVQVLYVLNNISKWRGELAKEVRVALKQHKKINQYTSDIA